MLKKVVFMLLGICFGGPAFAADLPVIQDFDLNRYLGRWYEIARLDHRFERGLEDVTATYSLRDDEKVKVVNRGYKPEKGSWSTATGKAKYAGSENEGRLLVSFFGPFYGGYNILHLEPDYSLALVGGDSPKYLWILSRKPSIPDSTYRSLQEKASKLGFPAQDLMLIPQERQQP